MNVLYVTDILVLFSHRVNRWFHVWVRTEIWLQSPTHYIFSWWKICMVAFFSLVIQSIFSVVNMFFLCLIPSACDSIFRHAWNLCYELYSWEIYSLVYHNCWTLCFSSWPPAFMDFHFFLNIQFHVNLYLQIAQQIYPHIFITLKMTMINMVP